MKKSFITLFCVVSLLSSCSFNDVKDSIFSFFSNGINQVIDKDKADEEANIEIVDEHEEKEDQEEPQEEKPTTQDESWEIVYGVIPKLSEDGKTITYGLYPQTNVNDSSLVSALNALTTPESNGWYQYNDEYYAKVSAGPDDTSYTFDNGTKIVSGTTYWFKCEPITWNVLSNNSGKFYVVSSVLLDAHRYNEYYEGTKDGHYANNYKFSEIRSWLNNDFYNSAFYLGNSNIQLTNVDNGATTTDSDSNSYACDNTLDKVFLPSYQDYINSSYGFSTSELSTNTRTCRTTDWTRARGAYYNKSSLYLYNGGYWTRSPSRHYFGCVCDVLNDGYLYDDVISDVGSTYLSVRPAITISLDENSNEDVFHGEIPKLSEDGKTITYGLYPQTNVDDEILVNKLNSLETPESNGWYLYENEYYSKTCATSHMLDNKFDNGTTIVLDNTYWFKCEPIVWNVLSSNTGEYYVVSSVLLDVHIYDDDLNNYANSEIRFWLNNELYNSAFYLGNSNIQLTNVDNGATTTDSDSNPYACDNTHDKVFLPSYQDYINNSYGFLTSTSETNTRFCKTTDWARARGAFYYSNSSHGYNGEFWTRSPSSVISERAWLVFFDGSLYYYYVGTTNYSVRPSLSIKIS